MAVPCELQIALGQWLTTQMAAKKLTQGRLARQLGVHRSSIKRYIDGSVWPPANILERLLQACASSATAVSSSGLGLLLEVCMTPLDSTPQPHARASRQDLRTTMDQHRMLVHTACAKLSVLQDALSASYEASA